MSEAALRFVSESVQWSWMPAVVGWVLFPARRRLVAVLDLGAAVASAGAGVALQEVEPTEGRKYVLWLLLRLFAISVPVVLILRGARVARPGRLGDVHCRHCGYNLIGNVSGICPECGSRVHWRPAEREPAPPDQLDGDADGG